MPPMLIAMPAGFNACMSDQYRALAKQSGDEILLDVVVLVSGAVSSCK